MRLRFVIALLAVILVVLVVRPRAEAISYYVQLVRAGDATIPLEPNSKRVGPRLIRKFQGPLKWTEYWEIERQELTLLPGHAVRVSLRKSCDVEIDLTDGRHRTVTAFENGKIVARTSIPIGEAMTLIGSDRDERSAWFIVVRRDRPMLAAD
jgi:hypothetical protein